MSDRETRAIKIKHSGGPGGDFSVEVDGNELGETPINSVELFHDHESMGPEVFIEFLALNGYDLDLKARIELITSLNLDELEKFHELVGEEIEQRREQQEGIENAGS